MAKENIYRQDLSYASSEDITILLNAWYKKLFEKKGFKIMSTFEEKRIAFQHSGIDRRLFLRKDGVTTQVTIEEKIRRNYWDDFLFEIISNDSYPLDHKKQIGWIKKDLSCDYLAYFFEKTDKMFLFNWKILQKTYRLNGIVWLKKAINSEEGFSIKYAKNELSTGTNYYSSNLIIPHSILIKAYKNTFEKEGK